MSISSGSRGSSTRGSPYGSHTDLMDEEEYGHEKQRRRHKKNLGIIDLDDAESILRKCQHETTEYISNMVSETFFCLFLYQFCSIYTCLSECYMHRLFNSQENSRFSKYRW